MGYLRTALSTDDPAPWGIDAPHYGRFGSCKSHRILPTLLTFALSLGTLPGWAQQRGGDVEKGDADHVEVLFLGDRGHHQPGERFKQIAPVLEKNGIRIVYTDDVEKLSGDVLSRFDVLLLYANIDRIEAEQADALMNFVAQGGGFVPLHCASYCFRNSPDVVALIGAQFQRHGTGVFRTEIAEPDHPIMKDFAGFESWDETYVHRLHNTQNRTVLEYRVDAEGREPWTWIRIHDQGRVFYTAWGHDQRTFGHPGFINLVERGIRWAAGRDPAIAGAYSGDQSFDIPQMTAKREDVAPFEYLDVGSKIPFYPPSQAWGVQEAPRTVMQKPLSPEESVKHFVTPVGFHVELFASEPDIGGKPICMTWDHRGRLWVAETYDYPNEMQPAGEGRDRIRICEDIDGDGRADRFTVFADGLSIPSAMTFWRDGLIVQSATQTIFLRDVDGDDQADEREVLFSNWNMRDTHGGVSNFQYGLDNWIWAMQGYNPSRPVGGENVSDRFSQGFFRFRPDGDQLEFLRSTDNNTWGLGISEEGIVFGSTANRNPSVYMPIPNRYYERVRGWRPSLVLRSIADTHLFKPIVDSEKVRQVDQHGGYTAGAGHALYTARTYPRAYWNRTAFVNGPTGHLVGTFVLEREGSDFTSSNPFNLLASDDEWSAPIMAEVGPDGNVWVIDWYNYIVQHNPTPAGFDTGRGAAYESDLRDKRHGRIYRVVYDERGTADSFSLLSASPKDLVAALEHPTKLWRLHAQRLLVERSETDVLPALFDLAADLSVDEIGLNAGVVHALWTLRGLGALDGSVAEATSVAIGALTHPSAGVRMNALKVLPPTSESARAIIDLNLLNDADALVRLAALLALSDLPAVEGAGQAIVSSLQDPQTVGDRWLVDAAISAAATQHQAFLKALPLVTQRSDQLTDAARIVAEHFARAENGSQAPALLASYANADAAITESVIQGLADGWETSGTEGVELTEDEELGLERLMDRIRPGSRGKLLQLAEYWGSEKLVQFAEEVQASILTALADESRAVRDRIRSAQQLIEFRSRNPQTAVQILHLISPQTPPELAVGMIDSLASSQSDETGTLILQRFATFTPAIRRRSISVLMSRPAWTEALLTAASERIVQLGEISLEHKQALTAHRNRSIARRARDIFSQGGALPSADRQAVIEQYSLAISTRGDAVSGAELFKKHCANCHRHQGEGAEVGPDLSGVAVHPKGELLMQILDPSRNVEGNFRVYKLATTDGQTLSGLLAAESRTAVELFDSEGKKHVVLREEIDELVASNTSLMPDGFEKSLDTQQMNDLLEFMTYRGKFLPLDLSKAATISSARGMFNNRSATAERLILPDWTPKEYRGIPFNLIDPAEGTVRNVILLNGPLGAVSRQMPQRVELPLNGSARAIHLLGGVSGWGYPYTAEQSVSLIVRLHYTDGQVEDHALTNAVHIADYIRRVDVPESEYAFAMRSQQIRYLAILPRQTKSIEKIEFVKGSDQTAPVVMAVTVEGVN